MTKDDADSAAGALAALLGPSWLPNVWGFGNECAYNVVSRNSTWAITPRRIGYSASLEDGRWYAVRDLPGDALNAVKADLQATILSLEILRDLV